MTTMSPPWARDTAAPNERLVACYSLCRTTYWMFCLYRCTKASWQKCGHAAEPLFRGIDLRGSRLPTNQWKQFEKKNSVISLCGEVGSSEYIQVHCGFDAFLQLYVNWRFCWSLRLEIQLSRFNFEWATSYEENSAKHETKKETTNHWRCDLYFDLICTVKGTSYLCHYVGFPMPNFLCLLIITVHQNLSYVMSRKMYYVHERIPVFTDHIDWNENMKQKILPCRFLA